METAFSSYHRTLNYVHLFHFHYSYWISEQLYCIIETEALNGFILQIKIFWKQLAWPDVEGSYTFVAKIIDVSIKMAL